MQEWFEKLVNVSRNAYYATGNLLKYFYHQNYYKPIAIDLSRQTNTNFVGKLEDDGATMFFVSEKQQKFILNFSLDPLIVTE